MTQKWNLQDIKPAAPKKKRMAPMHSINNDKASSAEVVAQSEPRVNKKASTPKKKKAKGGRFSKLFVILILLTVGVGALTFFTKGAELTTYPRFREPNVNASFTAHKSATAGELPYEIMTLEAEGERQVEASGKETVTEQAIGTIIIYNNHQTSPLRLVTNTRFESSEGLIFKIKDSAVIPGYTTDDQGQKIPGSITAEVYADEAGEEYNIGPDRFTVPGFAGGPEFDNVYAESVENFTGGFDGPRFVIEDAELSTAKQALHTELRNSLLERVDSEKPAGFIVFPDAVTFTYETLPAVAYDESLATIKEKVVLRIPLFKEENFANFLAVSTVPGYEGETVRITDIEPLSFKYTNATTSSSNIALVDTITFELEGRPQIVWDYDQDKLREDLSGKNRTALSTVLSGYPAIDKAEATISPFWRNSFPNNPEEITIVEILEQ